MTDLCRFRPAAPTAEHKGSAPSGAQTTTLPMGKL